MSEASELLERARELTVSQSSLIEILLDKCKSLMNDNAILQGTIKATVAERDEARACFSAEKSANEELHKRVSEQMTREEIIEKASRAYWDGPRRDGSKATVPWDDKYLNELWKARVRDQIEAALIAIGVIQ